MKKYIWLIFLPFLFPVGYFVLTPQHSHPIEENQSIKKNKVHLYLINLDRSTERLNAVLPLIQQLPFPMTRFSAVDGNKLGDTEINNSVDNQSYIRYMGTAPKRGTVGCSLSHIRVWQEFLKSDSEYAFIMEDDITFTPTTLTNTINNLVANPTLWDVCGLELFHQGMPLTIKRFDDNATLAVYLTDITHAGAYLINRHAAKKYLEKAFPIKMPIDHFFTRSFEFNIKFRGIEPRPVKQRGQDSDIESSQRIYKTPQTVYNTLYRGVFQAQRYLIRFVYSFWEWCLAYIK